MEAKIKATGEIVHVGDYNTISHDPMYKNEKTGPWRLEELDFAIDLDYWTRLEHQYTGMAMQAIISKQTVGHKLNTITDLCCDIAHALVKKLKEKEERK
jgi:hypothetical protein